MNNNNSSRKAVGDLYRIRRAVEIVGEIVNMNNEQEKLDMDSFEKISKFHAYYRELSKINDGLKKE